MFRQSTILAFFLLASDMDANPLTFIKSRPALIVAVILITVMLIGFFAALHPQSAARSSTVYTNQPYAPLETISRKVPPAIRIPAEPAMVAVTNSSRATRPTAKPVPLLSIHVELPPDTNPPPLSVYAPMGRLVQCQLVNTLESGAEDTPIIGLVTEDLWHDGRLVIPAGAEVHGRARVDPLRERIISSGSWAIVQQTGEELVVNGIALDREYDDKTRTWGLTDGSPGLAGEVIRSQSMDEIKLFAATMLSGVASGLEQSQATVLGTQISGTARNAALNGTSQVLNTYAQQILDAIKKEGVFVRVPAGKQFYLYITETLDMGQARIGNLRAADRLALEKRSSTNETKVP
jgi:hypothetical protein